MSSGKGGMRDAAATTVMERCEVLGGISEEPGVLGAFGGDPEALEKRGCEVRDLLGYCELHIEQGPVLEELGLPVGVVTGIQGQSRTRFTFTGKAGHAGTVPMERRAVRGGGVRRRGGARSEKCA